MLNNCRHLGNILVEETNRKELNFGKYITVPTEGIICSIIDCSLSRLKQDTERIIYRELGDQDWLFSGDEKQNGQYQIYRDMKALLADNWHSFEPRSNLLWLHFIVTELKDKNKALVKKEPSLAKNIDAFAIMLDPRNPGGYKNSREALKDELFLFKNAA